MKVSTRKYTETVCGTKRLCKCVCKDVVLWAMKSLYTRVTQHFPPVKFCFNYFVGFVNLVINYYFFWNKNTFISPNVLNWNKLDNFLNPSPNFWTWSLLAVSWQYDIWWECSLPIMYFWPYRVAGHQC